MTDRCLLYPDFLLMQDILALTKLIKEGAYLTESAEDIIECIDCYNNDNYNRNLFDVSSQIDTKESYFNSGSTQGILHIKLEILKIVDTSPIDIDLIITELKIKPNLVIVAITELQLEGKLELLPGNLCNIKRLRDYVIIKLNINYINLFTKIISYTIICA